VEAIKQYDPQWLIGSSGSFDTLLALYFNNSKKNIADALLSNEIPLAAFPKIHSWLMNSTYEERVKHPVIPSMRAEYMPLASYLVKYVLDLSSFERLFHSAYSLKEGAMLEIMSTIEWPVNPVDNEKPEDYLEA
jgi:exopolyphosphatase/guanosine-5'-triphosphate,3'-diphosphate pyrophosphatase